MGIDLLACGQARASLSTAAAAGVSLSELSAVLTGKRHPNPLTLTKLCVAVSCLHRVERDEAEQTKGILDELRRHCELEGLRRFAKRVGLDPANLNRVLKGGRKPSPLMLAKLQAILAEEF